MDTPTWPSMKEHGRHSYEPTDIAVGDQIQVRADGSDIFLKPPTHKEVKMCITRNERAVEGQPHATCALAVTQK